MLTVVLGAVAVAFLVGIQDPKGSNPPLLSVDFFLNFKNLNLLCAWTACTQHVGQRVQLIVG